MSINGYLCMSRKNLTLQELQSSRPLYVSYGHRFVHEYVVAFSISALSCSTSIASVQVHRGSKTRRCHSAFNRVVKYRDGAVCDRAYCG